MPVLSDHRLPTDAHRALCRSCAPRRLLYAYRPPGGLIWKSYIREPIDAGVQTLCRRRRRDHQTRTAASWSATCRRLWLRRLRKGRITYDPPLFQAESVSIDTMRLGLFMMPLHPPTRTLTDYMAETAEKALLAERLGFDEVFVGEHFSATTEPIRRR